MSGREGRPPITDTPSSILLLRLQSLGSNTNLWGGYLNVAMQMLEQAAKGYQSLAVTGDATISWSNYTLGNTGSCTALKLTGTLSASASLTFPGYMNFLMVWNTAGQTVTIKCSGGTGVAIPNNRKALIFCDGVDYYSSAPTWTADSTTLTNSGDYVSYAQLVAAIAAITAGSVTGLALYSATATVANYIESILTASSTSGLSITKTNGGTASEQGALALDFTRLTVTTNVAATDRFAVYDATAAAMRYQARSNVVGKYGLILQSAKTSTFVAVAGNIYPVDVSSGTFEVDLPASASVGDVIGFIQGGAFGATYDPNGLKLNGSTTKLFVPQEQTFFISYHSSGRGWV